MGDLYSELLVKKDKTAKDSLLKYGLIVLTVLAVFAGLIITPLALIIAVALGIACYFVIPKTDVEYEYLFINGDFDIDMIMSKTKRKKKRKKKRSRALNSATAIPKILVSAVSQVLLRQRQKRKSKKSRDIPGFFIPPPKLNFTGFQ